VPVTGGSVSAELLLLLPARSRLPHKSQFKWIFYLAFASRSSRACCLVRANQARIRLKFVVELAQQGFFRICSLARHLDGLGDRLALSSSGSSGQATARWA